MKNILTILVLVICFVFPQGISADEQSSYLAVFANNGFQWEWRGLNPDLEVYTTSWGDFDSFCRVVNHEAKDRPIIIDIDSHGDDVGLILATPTEAHIASLGYIVKEIHKRLPHRQVTLLIEGCYSGRAYKRTIRGNKWFPKDPEDQIDNYEEIPDFPIYGIGSDTVNFGNFIFLQNKMQSYFYYEDLRQYEYEDLKPKITNEADTRVINEYKTFILLRFYTLNSTSSLSN